MPNEIDPALRAHKLPSLAGLQYHLRPEQVAAHQRERLIEACAVVISKVGYRGSTMSTIVYIASVSQTVFYEHFRNKDDCYLAVLEQLHGHIEGLMDEAAASHSDRDDQICASLRALVSFLAYEPGLARLYLTEPRCAAPDVVDYHRKMTDDLVERLRGSDQGLPVAELGVLSLIELRVALDDGEGLEDLIPQLGEILLAYGGRK